ncbi:hypothetical protein [Mesorhizobium sp. LNJC394B00]|uniref:hypothetical protein n=1 Tax=Mesorhizobium sp. LNJC394B00 TaxID=1287274 RepID=UPI0012EB150F|nr:hypothetical protein [Mesorhizobium sp. LNJC394B00]
MKLAEASFTLHLFRRFIRLTGAGPEREIALPLLRLPFLDRTFDLCSRDTRAAYRSAFPTGEIAAALDERMFEDREPLCLRIGAGAKEAGVPWEAFQAEINPLNRHKLAPLRAVDEDRGFGFAAVPDRMRVLALVGHPGPERAFDPQAARDFLADALAAATTASGRIERYDLAQLRADDLGAAVAMAQALRPNVVIFFGIGQKAPACHVWARLLINVCACGQRKLTASSTRDTMIARSPRRLAPFARRVSTGLSGFSRSPTLSSCWRTSLIPGLRGTYLRAQRREVQSW